MEIPLVQDIPFLFQSTFNNKYKREMRYESNDKHSSLSRNMVGPLTLPLA